jgi:hypothetical protein
MAGMDKNRIESGSASQTAGRIATLLAAACPVGLVFAVHGPEAALWVAIAASAGLWAVSDILARRGPTATVRVLRARKVELVSSDDRVVVALGETVEGKGAIAVYDRNGTCIDHSNRASRSPVTEKARNPPSVLGAGSPFAFGFGTETPPSSKNPMGIARRTRLGVRSESSVQRRKRIAAERRSQVLGAIELSCSFAPAQSRDTGKPATRKTRA